MPADVVMCARLVELLGCLSETLGSCPVVHSMEGKQETCSRSLVVDVSRRLAGRSTRVTAGSILRCPPSSDGRQAQRLCRVVSLYVALAEKLFDGPGACCTCFHLFPSFLTSFLHRLSCHFVVPLLTLVM